MSYNYTDGIHLHLSTDDLITQYHEIILTYVMSVHFIVTCFHWKWIYTFKIFLSRISKAGEVVLMVDIMIPECGLWITRFIDEFHVFTSYLEKPCRSLVTIATLRINLIVFSRLLSFQVFGLSSFTWVIMIFDFFIIFLFDINMQSKIALTTFNWSKEFIIMIILLLCPSIVFNLLRGFRRQSVNKMTLREIHNLTTSIGW